MMNHRLAHSVVVLAVLAACGGDDPPQSLSQQADSTVARDTTPTLTSAPAPAPASTPASAPTGATTAAQPRGTGQQTDAADAPAAADAELASARRLFTVQVASFQNDATAQSLRARLERDGVPVWTMPGRLDEEDYTRVRVGVAVSAAEARAIAEKIRTKYRWPVWIAMVEDRSAVPGGMLNATRSYAGGM